MECLSESVVLALVGGALDERVAHESRQHLAECEVCRALVAEVVRDSRPPVGAGLAGRADDDRTAVAWSSANEPGRADQRNAAALAEGAFLLRLAPAGILDDRYRIEGMLGGGGMGMVVLATDLVSECPVAIKLPKPSALASPEAVVRFAREAQTAARIANDHVVRVLRTAALPSGEPYIVMERLVGRDARELLADGAPLGEREAVDLVVQACIGVGHAHRAHVVHRDLKPANLFLAEPASRTSATSCTVKVLDFGVSKIHFDDLGASPTFLTRSTSLVGTPIYMSPEQIRASRDVDARADVWALGAILYELLTAVSPFRRGSMGETYAAILTEAPVPPSRLRGDLTADLERVILRCLEREASARFADANALARALAPHASASSREELHRLEGKFSKGSVDSPAEHDRPKTFGERFVLAPGAAPLGNALRAVDQQDGSAVALEIAEEGSAAAQRHTRDARVMTELVHPGIVRLVAEGLDPSHSKRFLAWEWLEGETLASYLDRERLSLAECMELFRAVAEAMAFAHRRGIVHRGIDASNIFLVGGRIAEPKIAGFGRHDEGISPDAPGGLSPEIARGDHEVDARSDVFALGALFYRCLTGRHPFAGRDALALLLSVLLDEPPRLSRLRPDVPTALAALVERMLCKAASERPDDAGDVVRALAAIEPTASPSAPLSSPLALTASEQRLRTVVLVHRVGDVERVRQIAAPLGGTLDALSDGSALLLFTGTEVSALSVRAVRCALAVRDEVGDASIAVVTEWGESSGPVGDRCANFVAASHDGVIRLDDLTARLVETRFEIRHEPHGATLIGERPSGSSIRSLVGRPTPFVGRDRELGHLESILDECIGEPVARAVLVTSAPGNGKSRLCHELLSRVSRHASLDTWVAHGDPMSAGAPYAMVSQVLRRLVEVKEGEPIAHRRARVRAVVEGAGEHGGWSESDVQRISHFLGEMMGVPFPDEESVQLRAARRDARLLGDQIRRAFEDFVAARCAARPLLVMLDDLQWGDLPSVRLIDSALRLLCDRSFMVVGFARPGIHDVFPRLWVERNVQEIRLGGLTRRAAERLVRHVLGPVDAVAIERIVERADGNAFFLEELIRATVEGSSAVGVLALLQARIESVVPEKRRVLRAGAVFGHTFARGGVVALNGDDERLDAWLDELVASEILDERPSARTSGERELVFRHALVRDAAYATLVDQDRVLGHRLAAGWLESRGETDSTVLAEHYERGGDVERAIPHYRRAAEQALEANDLDAAMNHCSRGIARGASGEEKGGLLLIRAEAHRWLGDIRAAEECAKEALALMPVGGTRWCRAAAEFGLLSARRGNDAYFLATTRSLLAGVVEPPSDASVLEAMLRFAALLTYFGHLDSAAEIVARVEAAADAVASTDPAVAARLEQLRVARASVAGDLVERRRRTALAAAHFRAAGDLRNACTQQVNVAYADLMLGCNELASEGLRQAIADAERLGLGAVVAVSKHNLGLALERIGDLANALAVETSAVEAFVAQGDRRLEGAARSYLALIHLRAGDVAAAEREARAAVDLTGHIAPLQAYAQAILAQALLCAGAADSALEYASRAREAVERFGNVDDGEAMVLLAHAEALYATGARREALDAIMAARARVDAGASRITDAALRARFLEGVPENARIVALARAWSR